MPLMKKRYEENLNELLSRYGNDPYEAVNDLSKDPDIGPILQKAYAKGIKDPNDLISLAAYHKAKPDTLGEYFQEGIGGFKSGLYQSGGDIATIVNALLGSEPGKVTKYLYQKAEENAPSVQSYKDVNDFSSALAYGTQGIGQLAGFLGSLLIGSGAGSLASKLGTKALLKLTEEKAGKELAEDLLAKGIREQAKKNLIKKAGSIGRKIGGAGTIIGAESGTIYNMQPEGQKSVPKALAGGTLAGLLDILPAERLLSKLPGGERLSTGIFSKLLGEGEKSAYEVLPSAYKRQGVKGLLDTAKNLSPYVKEGLKESLKQGILEGTTEAMQSFVERAFSSQNLMDKKALEDYINSGLIGLLGGAVFGGAEGALNTQTYTTKGFEYKKEPEFGGELPINMPVPVSEPVEYRQATYTGQTPEQSGLGPIPQPGEVLQEPQGVPEGTIKAIPQSAGEELSTIPDEEVFKAIKTPVGKLSVDTNYKLSKPVENVFKKFDVDNVQDVQLEPNDIKGFVRNLKAPEILEKTLEENNLITKNDKGLYTIAFDVKEKKGRTSKKVFIQGKNLDSIVQKTYELINNIKENPKKYILPKGYKPEDLEYDFKSSLKDVVDTVKENPSEYVKVLKKSKKVETKINPALHSSVILQSLQNGYAKIAVDRGLANVKDIREAALSTSIPEAEDLVDFNFGDKLIEEAQQKKFDNWSPNTVKHFITGFTGKDISDLETEDDIVGGIERAVTLEKTLPKDSELRTVAQKYKRRLSERFDAAVGPDMSKAVKDLYTKIVELNKAPENLSMASIKSAVLGKREATPEELTKALIRLKYLETKFPEIKNNPNTKKVYQSLLSMYDKKPEQVLAKTAEAAKEKASKVIKKKANKFQIKINEQVKPELGEVAKSSGVKVTIENKTERVKELEEKQKRLKEKIEKVKEKKTKSEQTQEKKIKTKEGKEIPVNKVIEEPVKTIPKSEIIKNIDVHIKNLEANIERKFESPIQIKKVDFPDTIKVKGEEFKIYETSKGKKYKEDLKALYVSKIDKNGKVRAFIETPFGRKWLNDGKPSTINSIAPNFSKINPIPDLTKYSIEKNTYTAGVAWKNLAVNIENYINNMKEEDLASMIYGIKVDNIKQFTELLGRTDFSLEDRVHIAARALAIIDKFSDISADKAFIDGYSKRENMSKVFDDMLNAKSILDANPDKFYPIIDSAVAKFEEVLKQLPRDKAEKLYSVMDKLATKYFDAIEREILPPYDSIVANFDMKKYEAMIEADIEKVMKEMAGGSSFKDVINNLKQTIIDKIKPLIKESGLDEKQFSEILGEYLPKPSELEKLSDEMREDAKRILGYLHNAINRKLDIVKPKDLNQLFDVINVAYKEAIKVVKSSDNFGSSWASSIEGLIDLRLADTPIKENNLKIALNPELRRSVDKILANVGRLISQITNGADILKIKFTDKITTRHLSLEELKNALKLGYGFTDEQINNLNIQDINKEYSKIKGFLRFTPFSPDFAATVYVALDAHSDNIHSLHTTIMHEVFHFIERAKLLKDNEIKILKDAFTKNNGLSWQENAAEAFGIYVTNSEYIPESKIKVIFRKIKDFLVKMGNFLKGLGFKSPNDIFNDILSGKVVGRELTAHDEFLLKIRNNLKHIRSNKRAVDLSFVHSKKYEDAEKVINASKVNVESYLVTKAKILQDRGIRELIKSFGGDLNKVKEIIANALMRGALPKLYKAKYAKEHEILLQAMHIPTYAASKTTRIIRDITKDLTAYEYDLFQKILVTRDIIKNVEKGFQKEEDMLEQLGGAYKSLEDVKKHNAELESLMTERVRKALEQRTKIMQEYLDRLYKKGFFRDRVKAEDYFHRITLLKFRLNTGGVIPYKMKLNFKGFLQQRHSVRQMFITDYITSEFEVLSQMISLDEQVKALENLQSLHKDKIQLAQELAEKHGIKDLYVNGYRRMAAWERLFTDDYKQSIIDKIPDDSKYAPLKEMDVYLLADFDIEVPSLFISKDKYKELKQLYNTVGEDAKIEIGMDDITPGIGIQRIRKVLLVPKDVADSMAHMFIGNNEEHPVNRFLRKVNTWFKKYLLFNIGNVTKYMTGNISGDLDKIMAYNPKILKEAPQAMKDVYKYIQYVRSGNKTVERPDTKLIEEMENLVRKGVVSAGITSAEIPDTVTTMMLNTLLSSDTHILANLPKSYMEHITKLNDIRESVLRISAYRYIKKYLEANNTSQENLKKAIEVLGGVASKKEILENLDNIDDIAARVSRDLLGDYANISPLGQYLRTHLIPFWSWLEINLPTYVRLVKNAVKSGYKEGGIIGAAKNLGMRIALMHGLYVAVALWNKLFFPDDADDVLDAANGQLALILGKFRDGTVITIRTPGALSDALAWFGAETLPNDIISLIEGKKDLKHILAPIVNEAPTAALNKLTQGAVPILKTVFETATGLQLYPDITNPRPVKSRIDPILRLSGFKYIYDQLSPYRPVKDRSLPGRVLRVGVSLLGYPIDTDEVRYFRARELVRNFLVNNKLSSGKYQIASSPRSQAALWYKQAIAYGDYITAEYYLTRYFELGGNLKDLNKSILNSSPINIIPKKYRHKFLLSLTPEDRKLFEGAVDWYRKVYILKNKIPGGVYYQMVNRARRRAKEEGVVEVKATPYDINLF